MTEEENPFDKEGNPTTNFALIWDKVDKVEGKVDKINTCCSDMKEKQASVETDITWLKRGYQVQTVTGIATFLTMLGLILKIIGVV